MPSLFSSADRSRDHHAGVVRLRESCTLVTTAMMSLFVLVHLGFALRHVATGSVDEPFMPLAYGTRTGLAIEIAFVYLPLLVHFALLWFPRKAQPSDGASPTVAERTLFARRWTSAVAFAFVAVHVWQFRVRSWFFGLSVRSYSTKLMTDLSTTHFALGVPVIAVAFVVAGTVFIRHSASAMLHLSSVFVWPRRESLRSRAHRAIRAIEIIAHVTFFALVVQFATGLRVIPLDLRAKPACGPAAASASPADVVLTAPPKPTSSSPNGSR